MSDGLKVMSVGKQYLKIAGLTERLYELIEIGSDTQSILKNKPPSFKPLKKLKEETKSIISQTEELSMLIISAEDRKDDLCQTEILLKDLQEELTEEMKGRCPLCGKTMAQK